MSVIKPSLRIVLATVAIAVAGYMGGLVGWLLGMVQGRNGANRFIFAGLRGMDATGAIGGLIGLVLLGGLASYVAWRLLGPTQQK